MIDRVAETGSRNTDRYRSRMISFAALQWNITHFPMLPSAQFPLEVT
jgi:hypothetical protein